MQAGQSVSPKTKNTKNCVQLLTRRTSNRVALIANEDTKKTKPWFNCETRACATLMPHPTKGQACLKHFLRCLCPSLRLRCLFFSLDHVACPKCAVSGAPCASCYRCSLARLLVSSHPALLLWLQLECSLPMFPLSLWSSFLPWFHLGSVVDTVVQESPISLTVLLPL